jgi:predicted flap endonuclease-1-like 5' DNA nuclease
MNNNATPGHCARNCWFVAALVGIVAVLYLMASVGLGLIMSFLIALLVAAAVGMLLRRIFCVASAVSGAAAARPAPAQAAPEPTPAPEPAPEPEPTPEPEPVPEPANKTEPPEVPVAVASVLKPSTALPGQQELAARKGSWRFEVAAKGAPVAASVVAADEAAAPDRPAALGAARQEGADNLKLIKGVGPKLEAALNDIGIYHFDQIAGWSAAEVAWADENLVGFKGRVSRDDWVGQARTLAAGGETEFSKRNG